jgi:hypothetical protein
MASVPVRSTLRLARVGFAAATGALSCDFHDYSAQQAQASAVAQAIVTACPTAAPEDEDARRQCSERLGQIAILRDAMREPFRWGQQSRLWNYDLASFNTTRFNPLVWRRMYLSLFMFSGAFRVEQVGSVTVVHLPYVFRNGLDPGSYPYPFWHAPNKWRDYQLATELHLVFRDGRMEGALRSAVRLLSRPQTVRAWDGRWTWSDGAEPHVTLYRDLFAPTNPHVERLDAAYRALEGAMRPYNCLLCHSPDNAARANPLELFSYPNQALLSRHGIRAQIEFNLMPPAIDGGPPGVRDPVERARLVELARAFESAADDALEAEGEVGSGRAAEGPADAGQ